jgi:hypothetical protein
MGCRSPAGPRLSAGAEGRSPMPRPVGGQTIRAPVSGGRMRRSRFPGPPPDRRTGQPSVGRPPEAAEQGVFAPSTGVKVTATGRQPDALLLLLLISSGGEPPRGLACWHPERQTPVLHRPSAPLPGLAPRSCPRSCAGVPAPMTLRCQAPGSDAIGACRSCQEYVWRRLRKVRPALFGAHGTHSKPNALASNATGARLRRVRRRCSASGA